MTDSPFSCVNCASPDAEAMPKPPFPNSFGRDIRSKVCSACWDEWKGLKVMIVNEHRLNLLEKEDRRKLREQMTSFLNLDRSREPGQTLNMRPAEYQDPSG